MIAPETRSRRLGIVVGGLGALLLVIGFAGLESTTGTSTLTVRWMLFGGSDFRWHYGAGRLGALLLLAGLYLYFLHDAIRGWINQGRP